MSKTLAIALIMFLATFAVMMNVKPSLLCSNTGIKAYEPDVKEKVIDMAINGSGIRDTSRVLGINKKTVINTLKKKRKA